MRDWNTVTLIGHIGQDGELKATSTGKAMIRFSLATSDSWIDPTTKERKTATEWHTLIAWERAAEAIEPLVKKGNRLMVKGKIHYNKFKKQDGTEGIECQIFVDDFGKMEKSMPTGGETSTGRANTPAKSPFVDSLPF